MTVREDELFDEYESHYGHDVVVRETDDGTEVFCRDCEESLPFDNEFRDLGRHVGHDIVVAKYGGPDRPANIAVECEDCALVLQDVDG